MIQTCANLVTTLAAADYCARDLWARRKDRSSTTSKTVSTFQLQANAGLASCSIDLSLHAFGSTSSICGGHPCGHLVRDSLLMRESYDSDMDTGCCRSKATLQAYKPW